MVPGPLLGCSILVLADEPFFAHCLDVLLRGAGADVIAATSPADALSLLERQQPSAVVLDTLSVSKAAQQVSRRLLRLGVPCVVCTSGPGQDQLKGVVVVQKPVRGFELIEALSRLTRKGEGPSLTPPAGAARHAVFREGASSAD